MHQIWMDGSPAMASAILGRVTEEASNNGRFAETVWHMTNSKTEDLPGDEECLTVVEKNSGAWCTTMVDVLWSKGNLYGTYVSSDQSSI